MIFGSPHSTMEASVTPSVVSGDQPSFRRVFERLDGTTEYANTLLLTFLPRGGLQIVQPAKTSEILLKSYQQDFQSQDVGTWQAITTGKAVRIASNSVFAQKFLRPMGYDYAIAAPLQSPLFEGYPGALHLLRRADQGAFTAKDLDTLTEAAADWQTTSVARRTSRQGGTDAMPAWAVQTDAQFFVFNAQAKPTFHGESLARMDDELRGNMVAAVREALKTLDDQPVQSHRISLADTSGDLATFNIVAYAEYPALGTGPVVFACRLPNCQEWGTLRPTDVPADPELSRLVPAAKFMRQEFHRSPALGEIAKSVHLSPFHFHRRFTEIMGLTPKHFMLDCQIFDAKSELLKGTDLAKIAKDCGFAHQSHFTSRFKQATGLTPTRWRRTMKMQLASDESPHQRR